MENSLKTCRVLQGHLLKLPPALNFPSTRLHQNWPNIFLSVKSYEGILNLENPRGGNLSGPPCMQLSHTCDWQCCTLATVTVAHMQLKLLHLVTATVTLLWLPLSPCHLESAAVVYKHLQCNIHAPETVASMLLHLLHTCEQMYDELSSSLQCTL